MFFHYIVTILFGYAVAYTMLRDAEKHYNREQHVMGLIIGCLGVFVLVIYGFVIYDAVSDIFLGGTFYARNVLY